MGKQKKLPPFLKEKILKAKKKSTGKSVKKITKKK